jgi:hypothetical protein
LASPLLALTQRSRCCLNRGAAAGAARRAAAWDWARWEHRIIILLWL